MDKETLKKFHSAYLAARLKSMISSVISSVMIIIVASFFTEVPLWILLIFCVLIVGGMELKRYFDAKAEYKGIMERKKVREAAEASAEDAE